MALDDLDGAVPQGSDGHHTSGGAPTVGGVDGVNGGVDKPGADDRTVPGAADKDPVAGSKRHADPGSPGKPAKSVVGPKPSKPPKGDDGTGRVGPTHSPRRITVADAA